MSENEQLERRARPEPGTVTATEVRMRICKECGYRVNDFGSCAYGCGYDDADTRPVGTVVWAVYEKTMRFLRDEEEKP